MNSKRSLRLVSVALFIFAVTVGSVSFSSKPAMAACSAPNPSYGTATMQLTVTTAATYRIWTRMNVPNTTNDSYLLEIDGGGCFVVGNGNVTPNAWTWVGHQNGNVSSKIAVSLTAGTHTIKAIGREPSVKFDRILAAADQNCVPEKLGDNCMAAADTTKPAVAISSPASASNVSGTTPIKATATDAGGLTKVEFYVQDVLKSTDTTAPYEYQWNTTSHVNGSYIISAKAYDIAGNSSTDARGVTVKNGSTQVPSAPTNIKASAITPSKVALTWQPQGAATGERYRILRNNVAIATVTTSSFTDDGVVANTKYSYHVIAVSKDNLTSPLPPAPVTVTTPKLPEKDTTPPTKPVMLRAKAASTSQINLTWDASYDKGGVKEYAIYRSEGETKSIKVATVTGTSYGDSGLASNTTYNYRIVAWDGANNRSAASKLVTAKTATKPGGDELTGVLRGAVNSDSGRPLAGAKVTVWVNDRRYQATTNWRGNYIIIDLPVGRYEVQVKADSYATTVYTIQINSGMIKWQDATLRSR